MSKIISIANHKGGVGKTTTVSALGVSLASLGKRVLLIDLDPQTNLSDSLSVPTSGRTLYDALRDLGDLPIFHLREGLDVCPGSLDLVSLDLEFAKTRDKEYRLAKILRGLDYDYILLDCPPSLGVLTINALTASKEVYIPLLPEALPAKGLGTLLDIIDRTKGVFNPDLRLGGIIITRYNRRKINRLVEESLRESFGSLVFKSKIRENVDISESPLYGKDILSYSPKSNGAKDYLSLAKEIISREG